MLFSQQGADLLADRPVLGYGVGQFGGIVAETHDPNWAADPRFGPDGFNLHDYDDITVDSFWLHLTVETGTLGLIAYLVWLTLLALPLIELTRRLRRPPRMAPAGPAAPRRGTPAAASTGGCGDDLRGARRIPVAVAGGSAASRSPVRQSWGWRG